VTSPRAHTAHGHWLHQVGPLDPLLALEGRLDADVVVIGGGYTGMWTAWRIRELEPEARVVVLEAGRCGTGPSGRNGGFALDLWDELPAIRERFGDADAVTLCDAAEDSVTSVGAWCEREGVDAWFRRGGMLQVSAAPAQDGAWDEVVQSCEEVGRPGAALALDGAATRARCDSPRFRGGVWFPSCGALNPGRLATGLRARLAESGVEIREHSAVRRLQAGNGGVVATTDRGEVRAGAAVIAAGAAGTRLPRLRNRLVVTSSHMVVTEPVPDVIEQLGWTGGEAIIDSRRLLHYFQATRDDRIAFGWGGGRVVPDTRLGGRTEVDPEVIADVVGSLIWFFPQLEGRRIDHAWGGPIDVSPTHLPMVGSLDPDPVHYAFGFTGNGVGPTQLVGRILASLALGRNDEPTRLAIVEPPTGRVPPEPLRYLGGTLVRSAMIRKERLEQEARAVDLPTRAIAGLPGLIGVKIGR
jgi:glycine/D-amino acid oxidase-like deaminating enzyme